MTLHSFLIWIFYALFKPPYNQSHLPGYCGSCSISSSSSSSDSGSGSGVGDVIIGSGVGVLLFFGLCFCGFVTTGFGSSSFFGFSFLFPTVKSDRITY